MRLSVGDRAPAFELVDMNGRTRSLAECAGQGVWLAFFRFTACPFCLRRVHQLGLESERIAKLPIRRFAIFPSPPDLLKKYLTKFPLPFDVLSDTGENVTEAYGLARSVLGTVKSLRRPSRIAEGIQAADQWSPLDGGGSKIRIPADFLLDAEHRVRVAYYGSEADDGIRLDDVFEHVGEALQTPQDPLHR
jgi:thioredoxin-dependent peroxiredoxin